MPDEIRIKRNLKKDEKLVFGIFKIRRSRFRRFSKKLSSKKYFQKIILQKMDINRKTYKLIIKRVFLSKMDIVSN